MLGIYLGLSGESFIGKFFKVKLRKAGLSNLQLDGFSQPKPQVSMFYQYC